MPPPVATALLRSRATMPGRLATRVRDSPALPPRLAAWHHPPVLLLAACTPPAPDAPAPGEPAAVVAAAEEAAAPVAAAALPVPDFVSDVPIVIGAGPAGLAVAADLGAALVLEADDAVGGRARWSGGFLFLVGTEEQAAAGLDDGPDAALADWEALTGAPPTDATRAFLAATDAVRDRLVGMGLTLALARRDPLTGRNREHGPEGGGPALVAALAEALPDTVEVRLSTPVRGLVLLDGRAAGVLTDDGWIGADTVVIATGGFVDRADLVALHSGWADGGWRMGEPTLADGAALDWAAAGGLGTGNLDAIGTYRDLLGVPGADGDAIRVSPGPNPPWVWVDATGGRFVDETATWSLVLAGLSTARPNVWGVTTYEALVARVAVEDQPFLVQGDAFRCASDWDALADAIAVDAAGLRATLEQATDVSARVSADPWGRAPSTLPRLDGTPCAFRPGRIGAKNFGGLAVDDDGRVQDLDGVPVFGLWAVGEAAGMGVPGLGGAWGFDGSLSAVVWSGWRTAAAIRAD